MEIIKADPYPPMSPVAGTTDCWKLRKDFRVTYKDDGSAFTVKVPHGFIHDGPSIPPRLSSLLPYRHKFLRASIIHDYGYENGMPWLTRREVDRLFRLLLKEDGVSWLDRMMMYLAVRIFGKSMYG